jgi:hypothetical protein
MSTDDLWDVRCMGTDRHGGPHWHEDDLHLMTWGLSVEEKKAAVDIFCHYRSVHPPHPMLARSQPDLWCPGNFPAARDKESSQWPRSLLPSRLQPQLSP